MSTRVSTILRVTWAPLAVVLSHSILAGLIGHRRDLDPLFHFLGGVAGAHAAWQILVLFPRMVSRVAVGPPRLLIVVAVSIVAVLWECAEFASDRLLSTHIQLDWQDTANDLALGIGGAVIGALIGILRAQRAAPSPERG